MDRIEQRILELIDQNAEKIIAFGSDIWHHAELGFQEYRTSDKFAEALQALGLSCERGIGITGVKSFLKEKQEGEVRIALMGEMDALPIPNHPDANPETGAAHCCGHDTQLTGVMGAALALTDPEIMAALGGNIAFMGVPCEEASASPEIKARLLAEGKISSLGGKCEFIRHGAMDDVQITVGSHTTIASEPENCNKYLVYNGGSICSIKKYATYRGIAIHPANARRGIDALSAARLAMSAIDMQREAINHPTDAVNVHILHGFIGKGGAALNILTDEVDVKYDMRSTTLNGLLDIAYRVDRSLRAGAMATGAALEIDTVPGYLPMVPTKDASVVREVLELVDSEQKHGILYMGPEMHRITSDYADLSNIMPVFQFMTVGTRGTGHTVTYEVADPYEYWVVPAKCFALMAYRLLKDNAARARQIIQENPPFMSAAQYVEFVDTLKKKETVDMVTVPEKFI